MYYNKDDTPPLPTYNNGSYSSSNGNFSPNLSMANNSYYQGTMATQSPRSMGQFTNSSGSHFSTSFNAPFPMATAAPFTISAAPFPVASSSTFSMTTADPTYVTPPQYDRYGHDLGYRSFTPYFTGHQYQGNIPTLTQQTNYSSSQPHEQRSYDSYSMDLKRADQTLSGNTYQGPLTSYATIGDDSWSNRKPRNLLNIVDPVTGKNVIQEMAIDKALAKLTKPKIINQDKDNDNDVESIKEQFASLVRARLFEDQSEFQTGIAPVSDEILEDQTTETQHVLLPKEILNMDSRSIKLYNKALSEGKDNARDIRVMIVGHYGAGKTTLTKRLFGESVDIMERNSTDGIDVHVGRCKVSLKNKKWLTRDIHTDGQRKALLHRLAKLMHNTHLEQQKVAEISNHERSNLEDPVISEITKLDSTYWSQTNNTVQLDSSDIDNSAGTDDIPRTLPDTQLSASENSHINSFEEENDEQNDDFVRQRNHLEELIKEMHGLFINNEMHCNLSLWDFAGQNIFYATHQAFLSRRAVYLLVVDLSRQINDIVQDDIWHYDCQGEQQCKISEFIEFWLNSIHEYCSSLGETGPPVILVGTFVDKLKQRSDAERCFYILRSSLVGKIANCHLTETHFHVDNSLDDDEQIEELRQYIVKVASEQSQWGESIPAKWITLEDRLIRLQEEQNVKVIQMEALREENRQLPVPIENDEELILFLKFHHETGTILYFGDDDMKNDILLHPQWLIDAFKSLITSAMFSIRKAEIQNKWHEFDRSAILTHDLIQLIWTQEENSDYLDHKELILRFMEKLGFVAKPKSCTEELTRAEDFFLVPCMLKDPPSAKIITCNDSQQFKSTSKLCLTNAEEPKKRFIPSTAFNKLLAACINQWPLSKQNGKYMIFCGGAVFQLENNHFLYIFLYDHVIQIWVSRLSIEGHSPTTRLCREVKEEIKKKLKENVRMHREILSFVKCPRASLYTNENMVDLEENGQNKQIPCYCQENEHVVSYMDIANCWMPEERVVTALHLDLEKMPTEKDFSSISRRIGKEFKQMAFELGLSLPEIEHIEMDNHTTADKITAVLNTWAKRMHGKATNGDLVKALEEIGVDVYSVFTK